MAADSLEARKAYNAAALTPEELCGLMARSRQEADAKLSQKYGEEIRTWVEDGPLKDKYRWRVPAYPATAEIWRLTRPVRSAARRAA